MTIVVLRRWLVAAAIAAAGAAHAQAPSEHDHAHPERELVFFLSAEAHHLSASRSTSALNEDAWLSGDIVLALTRDRFRLFGEYLLSAEEHDLERLQLGYELVPNTIAWIGRFHQPASAWNTEHHHGRYLQTSITRPSIELWEDESGVVPQHLSGLLFESRRPLGDAGALRFEVGSGLGPRIEDQDLDEYDLMKPSARKRRISWAGRLAWLSDDVGTASVGLVFARHVIPVLDGSIVAAPGVTTVRQQVYGLYATATRDPWHVLAAVYDVRLRLQGPADDRGERFVAGYVQASLQLPRNLVAYGRVEQSSGATRSLYVSGNHGDFEARRVLAGLRWDVYARHAITLEAGRGRTIREQQNEVRLQWSAALP